MFRQISGAPVCHMTKQNIYGHSGNCGFLYSVVFSTLCTFPVVMLLFCEHVITVYIDSVGL